MDLFFLWKMMMILDQEYGLDGPFSSLSFTSEDGDLPYLC